MNFVLLGVMMAAMLLFFHGRGHHEPAHAPSPHDVRERKPTAPMKGGDQIKPTGQSVRDADPNPEQLIGQPFLHQKRMSDALVDALCAVSFPILNLALAKRKP